MPLVRLTYVATSILASLSACADSTRVDEQAATPRSIVVTPGPSDSVAMGATLTLTASVRNGAGLVLPGVRVYWSSSDTSAATVANGLVTGIHVGTATITAVAESLSRATTVVVTPSAAMLAARGTYVLSTADGSPMPKAIGSFPPPNTAGGECCGCPLRVTGGSVELSTDLSEADLRQQKLAYHASFAFEKLGCPTKDGLAFSPPQSFSSGFLRGLWDLVESRFTLIAPDTTGSSPFYSNSAVRGDTLRATVATYFGYNPPYIVRFAGAFVRSR